MFVHSSRFYDALYSFKDYDAAVAYIQDILDDEVPQARTLLDVGCGTGRHLELLRRRYKVEGIDVDPGMLAVARERCPDVRLHREDMADFAIAGRFDVITCLFSSIGYVRTTERMRSAVSSMWRRLAPGGLLLIEPWFTPEAYWTGTITANHVDQVDLKISWMYVSAREQDRSVLDIHYMVGRPEGIETFVERHEMGLFTVDEHLAALRDAGLQPRYDSAGPFGRGLYIGRDLNGRR